MKHISNQNLAKIERSLFKSIQVSNPDLDKILETPELYDSIKKQINLENSATQNNKTRFAFPVYAFASILVVGFLGFSAYYFVKLPQNIADKAVSIPQPENEFQLVDEKPQPVSENKPRSFVEKNKLKAIELTRKMAKDTRKTPLKTEKKLPKHKKILPENASPFYALNSAGNFDPTNEGMSIVRADFSRAELSAMGVEVLNEIGNTRIKAEVMVSDDGQPRAIRILR